MLDIISNNPYRVLGVYSNSPKKELVANLSKINAFLKVKKPVSFPTDMPSLLPVIERTNEMVTDANSKLALPAGQFQYAQFWFMNATSFDEIALNNLIAGDVDKAMSIWEKREDVSSLQNRLVCNLILETNNLESKLFAVPLTIICAERLYTSFKDDFVKLILGENPPIDTENVEYDFLDRLCDEIGCKEVLYCVSIEEWKKHIKGQATKPLVDGLMSAVSVAKQSKGNGPEARYNAGTKLMNETKKPLAELEKLTGKSDLQYQMVADKVGLEILQCGIDYYNETEDEDALRKAMKLTDYALLVVVGEMARDRCGENLDILRHIQEERAGGEEFENIIAIIDGLRSPSLSRSISSIDKDVSDCNTLLLSIKKKLGVGNPNYMDISSTLVGTAVNAIVQIINRETARLPYGDYSLLSSTRDKVQDAAILMARISVMDMNAKAREYFERNYKTLRDLHSDILKQMTNMVIKSASQQPPRQTSGGSSSSGGGCYIATMVYGDYDSPQVMALRGFRDNYLAKRGWGRTFIKYYYKYSPKLVEKLKDCKSINSVIRSLLDQFIKVLKRRDSAS